MVTDNDFLVDKMKSFGKVPVVVGNGVNYELFSQWLKNKDSLQIKKQITYVGAIADWFDVDLVYKVATAFKDLSKLKYMEFNFNISELVSIIALLVAIIGGYVNTKIQITKLVEENKNLSEKVDNLDKKVSEICKKVDKIKINLAREGLNGDE